MRFASLGSGSAGNALVVEVNHTRLMLDCGFSVKETVTRLARLNVEPGTITGIVITHEHDDHAGGAFKICRQISNSSVAHLRHTQNGVTLHAQSA